MAARGMEFQEAGKIDLRPSRPVRERRPPDRLGYGQADGRTLRRPRSLPTHQTLWKIEDPILPAGRAPQSEPGRDMELVEEATQDYAPPEKVTTPSQPYSPSPFKVVQPAKSQTSSTYTYGSGSSRGSRKSRHQVELTPLQAALVEERRRLGEVMEIEKQIFEEQDLDHQTKELNRCAKAALRERERLNQTLTMQRRLRMARRELDEACLITSFIRNANATTVPSSGNIGDPPQVLIPLSASSGLQETAEPADSSPDQPEAAPAQMEQPMTPPSGSNTNPVPLPQPTTDLASPPLPVPVNPPTIPVPVATAPSIRRR
ncbi:uncharacterized protein V6R79_011125 [Siganus canaliculatus]